MKYVSLPDSLIRPLPFYLAMEEYLAVKFDSREDMFFMWQVKPTVIFGRNQVIEREVNVDYCRSRGIAMYRRRSGGGCVYADMSNIMFSCVTTADDPVAVTFGRYTSRVAAMLCSLGLDASATSRNDILIGDRKVSGNAFYHKPGRSIVHGTMLYDTDMTNMSAAITPSRAKLEAKGVESVRARITTLREHTDMGLEQFKDYAREYMCDGDVALGVDDVAAIEKLAEPYFNPEWIYGRRRGTFTSRRLIDGVGEFQVQLSVGDRKITGLDLAGDFFLTGDMDSLIVNRLIGVDYDREAIEAAMADVNTSNVIHGLTTPQLINLLFENGTE